MFTLHNSVRPKNYLIIYEEKIMFQETYIPSGRKLVEASWRRRQARAKEKKSNTPTHPDDNSVSRRKRNLITQVAHRRWREMASLNEIH